MNITEQLKQCCWFNDNQLSKNKKFRSKEIRDNVTLISFLMKKRNEKILTNNHSIYYIS